MREAIRDGQARLTGSLHHHLCHVLRITPGSPLWVVDEQGNQYRGQVAQITGDEVTVNLVVAEGPPQAAGPRITFIYGMSRRARTEWVLQKTTELGVDMICLAPCERSVTRLPRIEQKQQRWEEIINQATRQCGRLEAPGLIIHPDLSTALEQAPAADIRLLATMEAPHISTYAHQLGEASRDIVLAVGPEGGFAPGEVAAAQEHGFALVGLGERVLRTETAALALLSLTSYLCGKL